MEKEVGPDWAYWRDLYRKQNQARGDCGADSCRLFSLGKWLWR
jgi:hypothetical protein